MHQPEERVPCNVCDEREHKRSHVMCACCWSLVPAVQQQAVYDTWRRYRGARGVGRALYRQLLNDYYRARADAITSAQGALRPTTAN